MGTKRGFTLIEIMLALAIFSIIGLATVRTIQQVMTTKEYAIAELDLYNNLRAAISLMRYDLQQTFHVGYDDIGKENKANLFQNRPVAHTMFDGRKKELIFTSLSHRVYYANAKESEQTEISYFLQQQQGKNTSALMKRESGRIDEDLYTGGTVYTLVEGVSSLQFQYWDHKQGKWIDDWNSDGADKRDLFPMAIKVKVALAQPHSSKDLALTSVIKIAFPNNENYLVQY